MGDSMISPKKGLIIPRGRITVKTSAKSKVSKTAFNLKEELSNPKNDPKTTVNSDDTPQYQKPSVILEVILPRLTTITICILEVIIVDRNRTGPSVSVLTNMFHLPRILE